MQTTLEDFFEIVGTPTWRTDLLRIIKSNKLDLWSIDISIIADKYLKELESFKEKDLDVPLNALIICTILLKQKANKIISFFDLTKEIEKELRKKEEEIVDYGYKEETKLDSFIESLKTLTKKKEYKRYKKKIHYIPVKTPKRDFKTILDFVEKEVNKINKKTSFNDLKKNITEITPDETFYSLLFIHKNERIKIEQKNFYGDFYISPLKSK